MKKVLGMLVITLLLITLTVTCFAFPAPGKYESVERATSIDSNLPYGKYRVEIVKTENNYSGTIDITAKGGWHLSWSVPVQLSKNNEGRYPIDNVKDRYMKDYNGYWEFEEISDSSIKLYRRSERDNKLYYQTTVNRIK